MNEMSLKVVSPDSKTHGFSGHNDCKLNGYSCGDKKASSRGLYGKVAVILGYYNGDRYLSEQVKSIINQSYENLEIFIFDDCSSKPVDLNALGLEAEQVNKVHVRVRASNVGFTNNFLRGLSCIDDSFEFFAFSDQDDVWYKDKVDNALKLIDQYQSDQPLLYCARTKITNESCQADLGESPLYTKPPSFANSLVQNIAGGNTMIFNKAARSLIIKSIKNINVVFHDWWCYQIISGVGGVVIYDTKPCLLYRQHSENIMGSNNSLTARLIRIKELFNGRFKNWNDMNAMALFVNRSLLTPANQKCLDYFVQARRSSLLYRLLLFKRAGIYQQTPLGCLGLFFGLIINRV